MDEIKLQKAIVEHINAVGGFVWRTNNGLIFKSGGGAVRCGIKGGSDIQGIWKDGRGLYIEVKTGSKNNKNNLPREDQVAFLEAIKKRNGIGFVAYSLDEVIDNLK